MSSFLIKTFLPASLTAMCLHENVVSGIQIRRTEGPGAHNHKNSQSVWCGSASKSLRANSITLNVVSEDEKKRVLIRVERRTSIRALKEKILSLELFRDHTTPHDQINLVHNDNILDCDNGYTLNHYSDINDKDDIIVKFKNYMLNARRLPEELHSCHVPAASNEDFNWNDTLAAAKKFSNTESATGSTSEDNIEKPGPQTELVRNPFPGYHFPPNATPTAP